MLALGGAGFAQAATKPMMMSASDKTMMMSCNGMSKDMMMQDETCMSMMKMHPDMISLSLAN